MVEERSGTYQALWKLQAPDADTHAQASDQGGDKERQGSICGVLVPALASSLASVVGRGFAQPGNCLGGTYRTPGALPSCLVCLRLPNTPSQGGREHPPPLEPPVTFISKNPGFVLDFSSSSSSLSTTQSTYQPVTLFGF